MEKQGSHELDSYARLDGASQGEAIGGGGAGAEMVDYMLGQTPPPPPPPPPPPGGPHGQVSLDKLSFSDVLQFADFGPRLALNQPSADHHDDGRDDDDDDDSYFFRFQSHELSAADDPDPRGGASMHHAVAEQDGGSNTADRSGVLPHDHGGGVSESTTLVQQSDGGGRVQKAGGEQAAKSGRRKRPRSTKTSEEVESQRMTHIAVERNRRRQMNDYLRVLRSLMPGSYVQRGDQASIIGGAIEFIRELEQLIQCLESQKRRRLYGDTPRPVAVDGSAGAVPAASMHEAPTQGHEMAPPFYVSPSLPFPAAAACDGSVAGKVMVDLDTCGGGGLREEVAENKSSLADIEVRVLGEDAVIKVLSRRRPEQLIKTIAVLEEMHMSILHTNITTIEQTVLYSFNVKIAGEPRFTAEDIVGAVHQILTFIDVNFTL